MGRRGGIGQKRMRFMKKRQGMMNLRKPNQRPTNQQPSGPFTGTTAGGQTASGPMNTSNKR